MIPHKTALAIADLCVGPGLDERANAIRIEVAKGWDPAGSISEAWIAAEAIGAYLDGFDEYPEYRARCQAIADACEQAHLDEDERTGTWRVRAHCPRCRKVLSFRRGVSAEERERLKSVETIGASCPKHGPVDARVTWELERRGAA